jgi:hypothetical protein
MGRETLRRALGGTVWVVRRVGAGLLYMLGSAMLVWAVLEASDSLVQVLVVLCLGTAFLIGNAMMGPFEDRGK